MCTSDMYAKAEVVARKIYEYESYYFANITKLSGDGNVLFGIFHTLAEIDLELTDLFNRVYNI